MEGKRAKYLPKTRLWQTSTVTLQSDASNVGWGAHMRNQNDVGNWSVNDAKYHINIKEMLAVKLALKRFLK